MTDIKYKVDGNWTNAALAIYKVGAIYMSVDSTSPATLFGGTWVALEGRMLIGANSTYTAASTGGAATVTLTAAQSGTTAHGHGFTQPTVNGGATTTGTMSANWSHAHWMARQNSAGAKGTAIGVGPNAPSNIGQTGYSNIDTQATDTNHTHPVPDHTHTVSGGAVQTSIAANAVEAHNNMPPYLAVYMWKRTA